MADDAALVRLRWTVGDRWDSDEYAVFIDGDPVDLTTGGWSARAQARGRADADQVLATWSSAVTDPQVDGGITFATAAITMSDGSEVITGTVQLHHSPTVSRRWGSFSGEVDCELTQQPDPAGPITDNRTIIRGSVRAEQDVSR